MIDTVILSIPREKIQMIDMSIFGVSGWDLNARTKAYSKFVKNPSKQDEDMGLYMPCLTGWKRGGESAIKIQFSAPKLIYKNNLDELADSQFEQVIETLRSRLDRMGVVIPAEYLKNAVVSAVHYSKNIELTDNYTAQYVIGQLGKINLNKKFDLSKTRFMNDGQSIVAFTEAHSFVIYDKVADLARGRKRAVDGEQPKYQASLFEKLNNIQEILRLEVRLSKKRKMNAEFKKLGFAENPTFRDIFSTTKSKAVVMDYWNSMIAGDSALLFAHTLDPNDILNQLVLVKKNLPPRKIMYHAGLLWAVQQAGGMRSLRAILSKQGNDRTWYTIAAEARETATSLKNLKPREWYDQIMAELQIYEPFHIQGREDKKIIQK